MRLKAPQRREQLVEVATKLFARLGYAATTTSGIAEAAGVTEPILYRHFKNKQELFVAITRLMSERTMAAWHDLTAGLDDPIEQLRAIARAFPQQMRGLSDAYHVINGAMATSRDEVVLELVAEHYREAERYLRDILVEGQRRGLFGAELDTEWAAWQFIYLGIGYTMVTLNLPCPADHTVEATAEALILGFRAGTHGKRT